MTEMEAKTDEPQMEAQSEDQAEQQAKAAQRLAERNALAEAFDDVRTQSRCSKITAPNRWAEIGLVPAHMSADEFELLVYDWLMTAAEEAQAASDDEAARANANDRDANDCNADADANDCNADADDATAIEGACVEDASAATTDAPGGPATADDDSPFAGLNIPDGYKLAKLEGEWVLVPSDEAPRQQERAIDCSHIRMLMGSKCYYLYDDTIMTDAYANWSFLAAEDNDIATFASCVREESRVYPRPMPKSSLRNPPFRMTNERIEATFEAIEQLEEYADIRSTSASNGDVYYFSTDYLSPAYAKSLAEWASVERFMNV